MMNYLLGALGIGYYSSRPLTSLSKKEITRITFLVKWYCRYELGVNPRRPVPQVKAYPNPHDGNYYGQYDPSNNCIEIYPDECRTLGQYTSTLIHEYTHYLQPVRTKYIPALITHGYWNNPFEVEARMTEKKFNRYLLSDLRAK